MSSQIPAQSYASKILYNVPIRFDGKSVTAPDSGKGELTRAAVMDTDDDGKFDARKDWVLLRSGQGEATKESFESIADKESLAKLSAPGNGVLTEEDMKKAGISFAFDRNRDGQIEVNRSGLSQVLSKIMNGINEGVMTYNGKEQISASDKEKVGAEYFKDYKAALDTSKDSLTESFTFNQAAYDQYSQHIDNSRMVGITVGVAGLGTFALAYAGHASGVFALAGLAGLVIGFGGIMAASVAKLRPDLPVRF
ncbi:MAG: hypothetical protein HYU64_11950 [Armatimonadetes bacterium]|nr:hypothetical protein [Armatimonadota bacterium]